MAAHREFTNLDKLHSDVHFQQVLGFLEERVEDKKTTLNLYRRIWRDEQVRDQTTPAHLALKLAGIVKRNQRGCLMVRNPIYARVFNDEWVAKALEFKTGFERLLAGLHPDREIAGQEYERLHRSLVTIFQRKGAEFPEELADKTIDRVAARMERGEVISDLPKYCLGMARFILLENMRAERKVSSLPLAEISLRETVDERHECLELSLGQLSKTDREFFVRYYNSEGESHQELAAELGLSQPTMRSRAFRIKNRLADCVKRCIEKK